MKANKFRCPVEKTALLLLTGSCSTFIQRQAVLDGTILHMKQRIAGIKNSKEIS